MQSILEWAAQERKFRVNDAGCWVWTAGMETNGYGRVSTKWNGERKAHRAFYVQVKGQIPTGFVIDHMCRNRACVNPDHLRVVTHLVNVTENTCRNVTPKITDDGRCAMCGGELTIYRWKNGARPVSTFRRCAPCFRRMRVERRRAAKQR